MADNDNVSGWTKWVRNGRLSFVCWSVTLVPWITFKALQIPLEGLDTVFVLMSGVLAANLGISTIKPSASRDAQREADKQGETNA